MLRLSTSRIVLALLVAGLTSAFFAGASESAPAARTAAAVPAGVTAPAQASDGLRQEVTYSYVVDPEAVVTRVTATATVTHTRPDDSTGSWSFDEYALPVPIEMTNLWATVDGSPVTVSTDVPPGFDGVQRAAVDLSPALRYGQTREVIFGYELGPQSNRDDVWSQANEAAFMFPAWTFGDPGSASVEVRVPANYEVHIIGDDLDRSEAGGEVALSASNVEDPSTFSPVVLAVDDSRATTQTAETSVGPLELVAWPDHEEWIDFVIEHVEEGVPVLEDLVGRPWPYTDEELAIVETLRVVAEGFGGWYDSEEHAITIGDRLDPHLVVHELSHVWINFDVFSERWLVEGFAEEYAHLALDDMGREGESRPTDADVSSRPVPLSQWTAPLVRDEASQETEEYGYSASAFVIGQVLDEIGADAMREVLDASIDRQITYTGDGEPEAMGQPLGWRQALDLFENQGSSAAGELFSTYVLTQSQEEELAGRAVARQEYVALAEQGGEWTPPLEVRAGMAGWDFEAATKAMDDAESVLGVRDEIDVVLDGLGVDELGLEANYESAEDIASLVPEATDTLDAAEAYRDVSQRDGQDGILAALGAWGTTSADGRLDRARTAFAEGDPAEALRQTQAAAAVLDNATRDGVLRLASALVLMVAGVVALRWFRRRQVDQRPAPRWHALPTGPDAVRPWDHPIPRPLDEAMARSAEAGSARSGDAIAAERRRVQSQSSPPAPGWVRDSGRRHPPGGP